MEITEVRVYPVAHEDDRLLAYATLTFDDCFVVRDLRVIRGNAGLFVAMPSRKRQDGTYSDVAHPLKPDLREKIETKVIAAYRAEAEKQAAASSGSQAQSAAQHEVHKIAV
jgi:stage V sporulation protein G